MVVKLKKILKRLDMLKTMIKLKNMFYGEKDK